MQSKVCLFVLLSVLFLSAERAIDLVYAGHVHPDGHAVTLDTLDAGSSSQDTDYEPASNDCGHCLHGHPAGIFEGNPLWGLSPRCDSAETAPAALAGYLRAPPTPPPNI
jgi:hypothetical protein